VQIAGDLRNAIAEITAESQRSLNAPGVA
jgi:hypothetical protein